MPDFGRPDFGRPGSGSQEPSLDEVRRADGFIDALADGRPVVPQDPADAELAALLGGWRDELRWPPATGLIAEADAVAALNAGLAEKRTGVDRDRRAVTQPRNPRRGLSTIGIAAAAALCLGGFGAVVAGSGPGDALYGVRTMFGGGKQVRDDQIGLAAKTTLNQVQDLIAQGDWKQAQDKLVAVSTQVATIDDAQQKQELLDQFNDLSAKVVERDPQATAPPGVVYTVAPSSAALVPAVEPTSTPGSPSLTTSTTPMTSAPPSTSETTASATTSASSSTAPAPESSASSPAPTSPAASSTSVAPQSQQTTATSAAPSTAAATPTTTPAPVQQSTAAPSTAATASTTAEAPRAASTTAEAPAPQTTVSATAPAASPAPTPAPQSAPVQSEQPLPTAAVTTTLVPVPAG
jgi:hypothetical protein